MVYEKILFTKEECEELIEYRNSSNQYRGNGGYPNRSDISYKQWTIYRNDKIEFLFKRIIDFIQNKFNVVVTDFNEESWIYRYEVNDGYVMHRDNVFDRRFTIGVQLNDGYNGGDLMINYNNERIIIKKDIGNCYIFESQLLHGVSPITRGERFNFLTFIHNRNIKYDKRSLI